MVILTDDQQNPMSQPTKANILRAMHWLVKDAKPNDSLFFHYSGTVLDLGLTLVASTDGSIQDMGARLQILTATKMMGMMKSSILSTLGWRDIS